MSELLPDEGIPEIDHAPIELSGDRLVDSFGREHTDLRLSVTDACNLRCTYCMFEDEKFAPLRQNLTVPEISRVTNVARDLGIRSVRVTGGEPLVRKDVVEIVSELTNVGFDEISMTTNATKLAEPTERGATTAQALKDAGLDRINVSCDSLKPDRFRQVRRRGELGVVMRGIEAARQAGLSPIKMNVVVINGVNDDEILDFAALARQSFKEERPIIPRFIEFMPLGESGDGQENWTTDKIVPSSQVLAIIKQEYPLRIASDQANDHAPASRWEFADGLGEIGIIPTMTNPFCGNCDRLRLTADGCVMRCLFSDKLEAEANFSIRNLIRRDPDCSDDDIADIFRQVVASKKAGQDRANPDIYDNPRGYVEGPRAVNSITMSKIGG